MSKGIEETPQVELNGSKEKDMASTEDRPVSKKGRGLLHVGSRSSSQKVQASPAASGLSGVTASEPRDSIGAHSRESKGSMLGRRRNGSTSSQRSGAVTGPTSSTGPSQPNSPAGTTQRRRKGGLLSLLGCCGVPDDANALDGGDALPSHKLDKIPQRQLTSSRRTTTPLEQPSTSKTQLYEKEKEPQPPVGSSQDTPKSVKRTSDSTAQDQSTVGDRESKQTTLVEAPGPSITVNPPVTEHQDEEMTDAPSANDLDGDVEMPDADPAATAKPPAPEEEYQKPIPPPPPTTAPAPAPNATSITPEEQTVVPVVTEQVPQQTFLLPPLEPRMKGKKCLVLDLDETLVHSSFKVSVTC
jgi:carboxy-terminal domain RNA polymerase II polypeptide A small phosphatase